MILKLILKITSIKVSFIKMDLQQLKHGYMALYCNLITYIYFIYFSLIFDLK